MNSKSSKLVALKSKFDSIYSDYSNPIRSSVIAEYHAELKACGRSYFDDRLEAYALDHGPLYGEGTMMGMLEDGTLDTDNLAASVSRHIKQIVDEDDSTRIEESARG